MKLQPDYTNVKQSRLLLELGVPADSANMYYAGECIDDDAIPEMLIDETFSQIAKGIEALNRKSRFSDCECLPCWSAARLMQIFDICDTSDNHLGWCSHYELTIGYIDYVIKTIQIAFHVDFDRLEEWL